MGELVLLENELINIYENENNERIVDGKELHEFLEVGTRYNDWIVRKLDKYSFEECLDFYSVLSKSGGGRPATEYYLKIDTAKEIAMVENNEKGRQARKYFIEVEKRFNQQNNLRPMALEDILIQSLIQTKEMRLKQEEQERKLNLLELQQTQHQNKVVEMTEFISKAPDFKIVEQNINTYARRSGLHQSHIRSMVYKKIEELQGIDINSRVKNAKKKIQTERAVNGKKPYSESTLNQKVSGTTIIKELKLEKLIIEILMSMTAELESK